VHSHTCTRTRTPGRARSPFCQFTAPRRARRRSALHGLRCHRRVRLSACTPGRRRVCVPIREQASMEPRRPWQPQPLRRARIFLSWHAAHPRAFARPSSCACASGHAHAHACTRECKPPASARSSSSQRCCVDPPPHRLWPRPLLTVNSCIKVRLDLQADKSPVVVNGPFFPRVVNPRYRIRGTMCNARIQSSKAR
jgi:hypothetical protein